MLSSLVELTRLWTPSHPNYVERHSEPLKEWLAQELTKLGWAVEVEVPVDSRGDGMSGRVDLVVRPPNGRLVAIECDQWYPRTKSIHKVGLFQDAARVVVLLKCQWNFMCPPGLDAILVAGRRYPLTPNMPAWYGRKAPPRQRTAK